MILQKIKNKFKKNKIELCNGKIILEDTTYGCYRLLDKLPDKVLYGRKWNDKRPEWIDYNSEEPYLEYYTTYNDKYILLSIDERMEIPPLEVTNLIYKQLEKGIEIQ